MPLRNLAALGGLFVLAACGGSGSGSQTLVAPEFADLETVRGESLDILAEFATLGRASADDVPTSGSATYSGVVTITDENGGGLNASVIGGMALAVDFGNDDSVSAVAENFFDADGTAVAGSLAADNQSLDRSGSIPGTTLILEGQLSDVGVGDDVADFDYRAEVSGIFLGSNLEGIIISPSSGTLLGRPSDSTASEVGSTAIRDLELVATLEQD